MERKVSAIIPAYNAGKYLPEALNSILAQTLPVDEIIVMDDGSTDETEKIVSQYKDVKYFKQPNSGTAVALNEAIKKATGTFLAFLDADDLWLPDKLQIQINALEQNHKTDMVFGWMEQFISPELSEAEKSKIEFQSGPMIGQHKSTWVIKRDAFHKVGFFKGSFALEEFLDWYMRAQEMGISQLVLAQTLAKRRIHLSNSSRVNKNLRVEFPKLLKAALDRRRQTHD